MMVAGGLKPIKARFGKAIRLTAGQGIEIVNTHEMCIRDRC